MAFASRRVCWAAAALVPLVILLASPALPGSPPGAQAAEPLRIAVAIKNRKVDPSQKTIRVTQGAALELAFSADEPAELHLHGYDKTISVEPPAAAVLRIEANIAGRFSIEAHRFGAGAAARKQSHLVLLYLEVHPR